MSMSALEAAARLHADGRADEAEAAYRDLLSGGGGEALQAHQLLGLLLADRGEPAEALEHYERAAALGGASLELHQRRAALLRALGRPGEAVALYEEILRRDPSRPDVARLLGVALLSLGRTAEALDRFDEALEIRTDDASAWNNRAVAQEALGRLEAALDSADRAIEIDPHHARAHHNRGSALMKLDRLEAAIEAFDRSIALDPAPPEPFSHRAVALATLGRHTEALSSAEAAILRRSAYPEAHNTRSVALRALGRVEAALQAAETALRLRPEFPEAFNSLGSALLRLGRPQEACAAYREAARLKPRDGAIRLNAGMALEMLGDLPAAQAAFAAAAALTPGSPDAAFASAVAHIRAGDFRRGFDGYEARWRQPGGPRRLYPDETLWLGERPLGGDRLLVHAEQGFGDVIQFCRFAPMAAPPGRLALQVQAPLLRLMHSFAGARVIAVGEEAGPFEAHIPIMSLPLALKLELTDLCGEPYLSASRVLVEHWRRRLPPDGRLRVGLAWSGNPGHDNDANRSIPLGALRPLLSGEHQVISLQKRLSEADAAFLEETPGVLRAEDELVDFAETAALISTCDVVVSVDTAVAHLAGALGAPVMVMLPWFCDWRWMGAREDTPWYGSAELFRQPAFGDWTSVVARVGARLASLQPGPAHTRTPTP